MPTRPFEDEFFNIATYLYGLANNQPPETAPTREVLLRTYVNRAYYYLYHSARKGTLQGIQNTSVKEFVKDWSIKVDDIFRQHRLLREFYKLLGDNWNGLGLEEADDIADILNMYNTYRILADYHIDQPTPSLGRTTIPFSSIPPDSNTWKLLAPNSIRDYATHLLGAISHVFENIEENGHSQDIAVILLRLERKLR